MAGRRAPLSFLGILEVPFETSTKTTSSRKMCICTDASLTPLMNDRSANYNTILPFIVVVRWWFNNNFFLLLSYYYTTIYCIYTNTIIFLVSVVEEVVRS